MGKHREYHFWRWLILSIVNIPKLYVLVWGVLFVLAVIGLKTDLKSWLGVLL